MKIYIVFFLSIFISVSLKSQGYFFKRIDFEQEDNSPSEIFYENGRLFSVVGHFCGARECCSLVEFSEDGDTLSRKIISDVDPGFETTVISNDTITITGNNDPLNTHFRMAHFDFEGNKLGETMEIFHPIQKFERSFQLTTQKLNNKFHIMGNGVANDSMFSLMYVVDAKGELDSLVLMAAERKNATPFDSDINSEGDLVTFHRLDIPFTGGYIQVIKYNESLDSIWSYKSENYFLPLFGVKGAVFDDKVFFNTYTPGANHVSHSLRVIDQDKNQDVIYVPPIVSSNMRAFSKVKILSNGDILGMGAFQDLNIATPVNEAPWLIRMSPEGIIRWQRVFFELNPIDNEARFGVIRDVVELPNGDLFGGGDMRYEIPTSIVFKIDANGCLNPDDCGLLQIITKTDNLLSFDNIHIYPNPTSDYLYVDAFENRNLEIMLVNNIGKTVIDMKQLNESKRLNLTGLQVGVYHLIFTEGGQVVGSKPVVVNR